ncbi:DUF6913 domain-containing protein [Nonlabens sp.]|uniref:DUF6913 domain-containing protein n=1 Tax=Nonlabens sp. TaxID=1888209 RepID=UPI003F694EE8
MIFNGIKRRWLRKEIKKLQNLQDRPLIKWPESLVVIFNGEQTVDFEPFYKWAKELGIKKESVVLVAYVRDKNKSTVQGAHLVDRKLIKWSGGITDDEIKELIKRPFDLQVNYYDTQNDLLDFISLALPSRLKVAYRVLSDESLFDLSIDVPLNDYSAFFKELQKYLKILTQ